MKKEGKSADGLKRKMDEADVLDEEEEVLMEKRKIVRIETLTEAEKDAALHFTSPESLSDHEDEGTAAEALAAIKAKYGLMEVNEEPQGETSVREDEEEPCNAQDAMRLFLKARKRSTD